MPGLKVASRSRLCCCLSCGGNPGAYCYSLLQNLSASHHSALLEALCHCLAQRLRKR